VSKAAQLGQVCLHVNSVTAAHVWQRCRSAATLTSALCR
jgi:hypothetical protein